MLTSSSNKFGKLPITRIERLVYQWTERNGLLLLRLAMGIVFVWFGALKPFGLSPASDLVAKTTFWIPIEDFCCVLGYWEVLIGFCFLCKPLLRLGLIMLAIHIPGTLLPMVMLPEEVYVSFPFVLTLEGQYIVKNLVLISAALVIGGKIYRAEYMTPEATREPLREAA